jgi:hypothetical protein
VAPVAAERQLGWLYSDQGLHFKGTHTKPDTKFLTCRWADLPNSSRPVVAPPFVLRVAVKEASGSRRLLILPPLKLHNLLHCDMHYRCACLCLGESPSVRVRVRVRVPCSVCVDTCRIGPHGLSYAERSMRRRRSASAQ